MLVYKTAFEASEAYWCYCVGPHVFACNSGCSMLWV